MERLTKIGGPLNQCYMQCKSNCGTCKHVDIALRRLIEYEDTGLTPEEIHKLNARMRVLLHQRENLAEYLKAEEQGLLIKLPCNVGNTVYIVFNEYGELFIQAGWAVTEITITGDDILFDFECFQTEESESRNIDSFGKTVFLTIEEAEEAMKSTTPNT